MNRTTITVTNHLGDKFTVKLVRQGESYGRDKCLVHKSVDPLVEFYDAEYAGRPGFDAEGQFVSRYFASTLLASRSAESHGLNLCGHEPKWQIDADAFAIVLAWLGHVA
jgi:hypothetical protein